MKTLKFSIINTFFILSFILISFNLFSQNSVCDFDEFYPTLPQAYKDAVDDFDDAFNQYSNSMNGNVIIPVVVHVLYSKESENISDEQIYRALELLNNQLKGDHNEDGVSENQNSGIQVILAGINEIGECTSGILRYEVQPGSVKTSTASSWKLNRWWDHEVYCNIWVAPDDYNNYGSAVHPGFIGFIPKEQDGITIRNTSFGDIGSASGDDGNTLAHEFGHYLGLYHVWGKVPAGPSDCPTGCFGDGDEISDTNPCIKDTRFTDCSIYFECQVECGGPDSMAYPKENYLSYATSCRNTYTLLQIDKMWQSLNNNIYRKELLTNDPKYCYESPSKYINSNEIWTVSNLPNNGDVMMFEDIIIENGGYLTLTPGVKITFCGDKKIVVNKGGILFLNGAHITSCDEWEGIIVRGTSDKSHSENESNYGIVRTRNNAIIENARIGIAYSENDSYTDWGGLIECDYTSFKNCWKGSQFLFFAPENESYFKNCSFITCKDGVTIWDNSGIEFENNYFNVYGSGIVSVDAAYEVYNHNIFFECPYGIKAKSTSGNKTNITVTGNNKFEKSYTAISLSGIDGYKNSFINDNIFENNERGVVLVGKNYYRLLNNEFTSHDYGIVSGYTGARINKIGCNELDNQFGGILMLWNNSNTSFVSNDFLNTNASGYDFSGHKSTIREEIGGLEIPAMNCFSGSQNDIEWDLNNESFLYWKPQVSTQCSDPSNPGNYSVQKASNNLEDICDGSNPLIPTTVTSQDVVSKINDYCIKINLYRNDPSNILLKKAFRNSDLLLQIYFDKWAAENELLGNHSQIENMIKSITCNDHWKIRLFNHYIKLRDFSSATTVLNDLDDPLKKIVPIIPDDLQTDSRNTFIDVQRINLKILLSNFSYELTEPELDSLKSHSVKTIPESAYAQGLLYLINGEEFDIEIPSSLQIPVIPRTSISVDEDWVLYPNPTEKSFNVMYKGESEFYGIFHIYDLNGELMLENEYFFDHNKNIELNVSDFHQGFYIVNIRNKENELIQKLKLVIQSRK